MMTYCAFVASRAVALSNRRPAARAPAVPMLAVIQKISTEANPKAPLSLVSASRTAKALPSVHAFPMRPSSMVVLCSSWSRYRPKAPKIRGHANVRLNNSNTFSSVIRIVRNEPSGNAPWGSFITIRASTSEATATLVSSARYAGVIDLLVNRYMMMPLRGCRRSNQAVVDSTGHNSTQRTDMTDRTIDKSCREMI